MAVNLAELLIGSSERHRDRTAIALDGLTVSYARLNELSARVAGLLSAKGIGATDLVAHQPGNARRGTQFLG